jgi:Glycosyltransferase family 87
LNPLQVRIRAGWGAGGAGFFAFGVLVTGVCAWWILRAYHDSTPYDMGLAYQGGQAAWATGHPEHLATWISTPFLGMVMALVTRVTTLGGAADTINAVNLVLVLGTVVVVLRRLRPLLARRWLWPLGLLMVTFGPLLSTVWWKQFNLIALVGALAGYDLIRRRRAHAGAALIGLTLSVKPLIILLPFVLLARRRTRRAGALMLAYAAGVNVLGQVFMAWRAHALSALNVLPVLQSFSRKSQPANLWSCVPEDYSPTSLLCRVAGSQNWNLQHVLVLALIALLAAWTFEAVRDRGVLSWEVFAFTCAYSVMVSPIAWSHYQIMLAPLFVLLFVRFAQSGAGFASWYGYLAAFALASLTWQPYGTLIGTARHILTGSAQTEPLLLRIEGVAQFAQYLLVITGILWYMGHDRQPVSKPEVAAQPSR